METLNQFYVTVLTGKRGEDVAFYNWLGSESKTQGEEWIILLITKIHREPTYVLEPSWRKFCRKSIITEKNVSYALAFCSR